MSDPEYDDEYYDGDDAVSEGGVEGMDPDHPLLARAQAALKKQLLDTRLVLDEKIREKTAELDVRSFGHTPSPALPSRAVPARATPTRPSTRCGGWTSYPMPFGKCLFLAIRPPFIHPA